MTTCDQQQRDLYRPVVDTGMTTGSGQMNDVTDLVARFGTPLYVYDLDQAERSLTQLRSAIPAPSTVYYSLKANPHPELVRALHTAGARAEISSTGELAAAEAAGVAGTACLYTGPGKTHTEIDLALSLGVRRFSVESPVDYERIAHAADARDKVAECLLRVNSTEPVGNSSLRMTGKGAQFGIDEAVLYANPGRYRPRRGARVVGIHLFPISNARAEQDLLDTMRAGVATAARIRARTRLPVTTVDLGGGFAAPYGVPGEPPRYPRLRAALEETLDEGLPGWRTGEVEISFESGRYLAGSCGRLVSTVLDVRSRGTRSFVVLDSGINHIGGLAGLGRSLPAAIIPTSFGGGRPASLVGPLCTPADVLARDIPAGELTPGDLIEVSNVGAYGLTASLLGFLSRPAPTEVIIRNGVVVAADRAQLARVPVPLP